MDDLRAEIRLGIPVKDMAIGNILALKAEKLGDKIFLTNLADERVLTYAGMHRESNQIANGLLEHGIGKGCHVAVMMENCPEQLLAYFGLGKVGAVAVPVNVALRGQLLSYVFTQSDSMALIVDEALVPRLLELEGVLGGIRQIFVLGEAGSAATRPVDSAELSWLDFTSLRGAEHDCGVHVDFREPAYIMYTSGTTGPSKGVIYTQARALLAGTSNAETWGFRHTDICYVSLPLFHLNALQGSVYGALMTDGAVALARRFSASQFWSDIRRSKATMFNLLGSMANIIWSAPPSPDDREHNVRMCVATPCPPFALAFEERFGLRLASGYGISDFASTISFTLLDPPSKLGSAGRSRRGYEVRIVDENDFDLPCNQPGEIILRSNLRWDTSSGYYKMPEATLHARRNGWFHTGDRGYLDEDGYLWFVDRSKDAIRRRGENISATEVEQVILRHPSVADAAVFAVRSEMSEEEVAAVVALRPGATLAGEVLIRHCERQMAYFMVPRFLRFVADLPRTETQKVEKFRLREEAEKDIAAFWDREREGVKLDRR